MTDISEELRASTSTDRVAIVAGGSGGVGVRTCGALAGVGAKVAIIGRSKSASRQPAKR